MSVAARARGGGGGGGGALRNAAAAAAAAAAAGRRAGAADDEYAAAGASVGGGSSCGDAALHERLTLEALLHGLQFSPALAGACLSLAATAAASRISS